MQDPIFSSIDFIGQCLVDHERTTSFQKAIVKSVKKNDIILDLGTGSGILALLAAKQGAKKIIAVEFDPFVAMIAKNNFRQNGFSKKISILIEDARHWTFSKKNKFNIVISEMLTTGMVDEHQVQAINNLHHKKLIDTFTTFIPERQDTYISLANADLKFHGQKISMTLHLWGWHRWKTLKLKKMSKNILLNSVDFRSITPDKFVKILEITPEKSGTVNAIYLSSKSILPGNITIDDTEALNSPMLVPIKKKSVKVGQRIRLKIQYIFGGSYSNFKAEII